MPDSSVEIKTLKLPHLDFRRVQCEHEGRGEGGKRLKDLYIAPLANGQGWLIMNYSGAMVRVPGLCPLPGAVREAVVVLVEGE